MIFLFWLQIYLFCYIISDSSQSQTLRRQDYTQIPVSIPVIYILKLHQTALPIDFIHNNSKFITTLHKYAYAVLKVVKDHYSVVL